MDEELARAEEAFGGASKGKLDQRVTFIEDGKRLEEVRFHPEPDGTTFKLKAAFLNETPVGVADSGKPLGHAGDAIRFRLIGGWAGGGVQTGPDTFRIQPSHFGLNDNIMVLAYHPGDAQYSWTEQPCQIKYPRLLNEGKTQTLDFPALPAISRGSPSIELRAKSDAGLPVEFYVQSGPAELAGTSLHLTQIPARAKYPVKITVAAYQRGRLTAPQVKSAEPVFRTIEVRP
jgi:hypothetical protein